MTDQEPLARSEWETFAELLLGDGYVAKPDDIYVGLSEPEQFELWLRLAAGGAAAFGVPTTSRATSHRAQERHR